MREPVAVPDPLERSPRTAEPTPGRLPRLVAAQVLNGMAVAVGVAVGTLLAEQVSGSAAWAGLAQTASVLGGALLAVPLAGLAERSGRGPALVSGYVVAAAGAVTVIAAAGLSSFVLLLLGMVLFGAGTACGLQARYAAIDGAEESHRARLLSVVVWSTTVGAVLGPNLSELGGRAGEAIDIPALAGPFLFSVAAYLAAAICILTLPRGREPLGRMGSTVSLTAAFRAIGAVPAALAGLAAIAGAHAVMVGVMVMTPVHLGHGGATLQVVGLVISLHIAGMYALSPVMGGLADRLGTRATIGVGVGLLVLALLVTAGSGRRDPVQVGAGLTLLGLGWSACLVAGSALLSGSVPPAVRTKVQGAGDMVMGLTGAAAGVAAGPTLTAVGYQALALLALTLLVPVLVLVRRARSGPAPVPVG